MLCMYFLSVYHILKQVYCTMLRIPVYKPLVVYKANPFKAIRNKRMEYNQTGVAGVNGIQWWLLYFSPALWFPWRCFRYFRRP